MAHFRSPWSIDSMSNMPLYGDTYVRYVSSNNKRKSAPPRPPRPEAHQLPKAYADYGVVEVNGGMEQYGDPTEVRVPGYDLSVSFSHYYGPVTPVSPPNNSSVSTSDDHASHPYSMPGKDARLLQPTSLRRRPFSFESLRSVVSKYSQQLDMRPEQLHVPYTPAQIYDEYADIASSNPFLNDTDSAMDRYLDRQAHVDGFKFDRFEPSRKSSQARNTGANTPIVPMSRYNSARAPPPTPDPEEIKRQLDAAWEEVKRAVAPKLKVVVPAQKVSPPYSPVEPSHRPSTTHALPPSPPPPPIPVRNPRRPRRDSNAPEQFADASQDSKRLSHSASSPSMMDAYRKTVRVSMPPVPSLPRHVPAPIPASNLPVNIPAPLPTPAASDCSSHDTHIYVPHSPHSPHSSISSMRRTDSAFSGSSNRSGNSTNGNGAIPISPATEISSHPSIFAPSSLSGSSAVSALSPTGRGFHEPPPVAPTIKPMGKRHSIMNTFALGHDRMWSDATNDSKIGITTAIWAGPSPPAEYVQLRANSKDASVGRSDTLRSIAPGESAARTSFQPPMQISMSQVLKPSVVAGTNGEHILLHATQQNENEFAPIKIIPLPEKQRTGNSGEHMPRFSNNFAGFCKGAWRLQTQQTGKAFSLRTTHRKATLPNSTTTHTKTTTLKCGKCSFEGALARHPATLSSAADFGPNLDYLACAERTPRTAHGVVYRWSFLFKSHVSCKTALRKDEILDFEDEVFGCVFCCSEGKGTWYFKGAKTLCGHIAKEHAGGVDLNRELKQRVAIVVARSPDKNEEWDIVLPGRVWV